MAYSYSILFMLGMLSLLVTGFIATCYRASRKQRTEHEALSRSPALQARIADPVQA